MVVLSKWKDRKGLQKEESWGGDPGYHLGQDRASGSPGNRSEGPFHIPHSIPGAVSA